MSQTPARARKSATVTHPAASPRPRPAAASVPAQERPDQGSKTFLWQQLVEQFRGYIDGGDWAAGQLIPSETELITTTGASRPTVRRAVQELRKSGLLDTEHGRGSRVRPGPTASPASVTLAFNPTLIHDPRANVFTTWDATGWDNVHEPALYQAPLGRYGDLLRLSPGEPAYIYERRLAHTSTAQLLHRLYIPYAVAATVPTLAEDPSLRPDAVYRILSDAGFRLRWTDSIHAEMPTPDDATSLQIPEGVPLLVHTRVTLAADGRPLTLEETRLRADRARILALPVQ